MNTERIIITFNEDGSWRGASATDFGGHPVTLSLSDLSAACSSLNTVLLATITDLEAKLAASENPNAVPDAAPSTGISKLKIRRALRSLGYEDLLDSFLSAVPTRLADWNDAHSLELNDPLLIVAIPEFVAVSGLTTQQITDMLNSCTV